MDYFYLIKYIWLINLAWFEFSSNRKCAVSKMVITKPIGILFENGQKINEVDMERKTIYWTCIVQSFQKSTPLSSGSRNEVLFPVFSFI